MRGERGGGDEFVILYTEKTEQFVLDDISKMRSALSKTGITCAFGYCMKDKETDLDTAMKNADQAMYADKSEIKKAVLAAGGQLHRSAGDR